MIANRIMKKTAIVLVFILISFMNNAQSPDGFKYQAVVRNSYGEIIANQAVTLQISILQGSNAGTAVFTEVLPPLAIVKSLFFP